MNQVIPFLTAHWFAALLLFVAVVVGGVLRWLQRRRGTWSVPLIVVAAALALLGLGGLVVPAEWGWWIAGAAAGCLFVMFLVLILTGHWWAPLAAGLGGLALLGLGAAGAGPVSERLRDGLEFVRNLRPMQPWWLLLLALIPVIILLSYRSLAGLGPVRRWIAIGLRCALVLFLALALAEAASTSEPDTTTVIFCVDRSLSVPEDLTERIEKFLNEAVQYRGSGRERYKSAVILFARRPRLERAPSDVSLLNFRFKDVAFNIDGNYTDIGAAIKLALASFPEGTDKRLVLLSDGNENLGNALEQARLAQRNGVQIDTVALAVGRRVENEVLVQSVEAPSYIEQGSYLRIRVLIRSFNPNVVRGTLTVNRIVAGVLQPDGPERRGQELIRTTVDLQPGLNSFVFEPPGSQPQGSYSYQAEFHPQAVLAPDGRVLSRGLPGDRVQNNRATTHVVARGQSRVLLLGSKGDNPETLLSKLPIGENAKFRVIVGTPDLLPVDKDRLAVFLSNFDCVILHNLPADAFTETQQEMLRSNTAEQGCGLVMIGGPDSFGAGGWQNTPVERALPVDTDIKSFKVQGKVGLALIMHASEMAKGNYWQKQIAKLAINELSPMDEVGILHFDFGGHKWHIPMQEIGEDRAAMMAKVDTLQPGDMPDFDPALKMAYDALMEKKRELASRHVIIISDGDPVQNNKQLLAQMRKDKVTVSTVGVATHGAPQDQALLAIAQATRGRFYNVKNAALLPAIYLKETRLISQSFVYEKRFALPDIARRGPTEGLPRRLEDLYGFVRTTPKPNVLVETPILSPEIGGQQFPILAYWHYGLGKAVAFTSDALPGEGRQFWARDWAGSPFYAKFWEQVIDWALRPVESKNLTMTTEYRDGRVRVVVDARNEKNQPRTDLTLRGAVTTPSERPDTPEIKLKFEQKSSGVYEAEFPAEEAGSYFINAAAVRKVKKGDKEVEEVVDSVRAGATIPYSPEFADLASNTTLLKNLAEMTGGNRYDDSERGLAELARSGELFRPGQATLRSLQPIWFWLVLLTGVLLFFDVAVRRIALDPAQGIAAGQRVWNYLRGRTETVAKTPEFLERLKSR
ncbi:MAG TPA: VWA domain-containing protein, partial [Gemmataceae bacterium]|nr:VWA domain-containing protein [Gemmataceae bacterium]